MYIHISSLVHNTNSKPYFGNPNYTTSKQLICVLRCPQVFSELWQNQLGRVGLHSRVSEGWLSVFQGWVALRRMDPIVGCWVHPTSTRLFTRCPDADSTQHGTTGESPSLPKGQFSCSVIIFKKIGRTIWRLFCTRRMTSVWNSRMLLSQRLTRFVSWIKSLDTVLYWCTSLLEPRLGKLVLFGV